MFNFNNLFSNIFNNTFSHQAFDFNPFGLNGLFNSFSHYKNSPTTTSGTDVNVGYNQTYTVKTNGLNIHGNKGTEKITVAQNVSGINVDSTVESVTLKGVDFDSNLLSSKQGALTINTASGVNLVTLNVAANHNETLSFSNAIGSLSLDDTGNAIFNLSQLQLAKNQSFTVNSDDVQIWGNTGTESVTIAHGVIGAEISNLVESVVIDGKSSDYNYDLNNGSVIVSDKSSGNAVAFIDVNQGSTGTSIQFTDKTLNASWEITNSLGWWNQWGVVINDPDAPAIPTTISGGTNLPYTVNFSHANLGEHLADVEASMKTALENIGQYVTSSVPFDLQVFTQTTDPKILAETNATMVTAVKNQEAPVYTTAFLAESKSGADQSLGMPDATITINLANLDQMDFDGSPDANQYDLVSILTHEILHGMAFTGNLETKDGMKSPFDTLVNVQNSVPVFTGTHAQAANGNSPVLLDTESAGDGSAYYHVTNQNDLMADAISKGEVRTISPLDIAMLEDLGVTLVGVAPTLAA